MIHAGHRISKDIDAFIHDPQYLSFLSPRLAGEAVWGCEAFNEAAHYLKLIFPEGEIDFIVAAPITDLKNERKEIEVDDSDGETRSVHVIDIEHPVETALKKLYYRGNALKVRDIFDIDVVATSHSTVLEENLHRVAHLKSGIVARLAGVSDEFFRLELDELAISEGWRKSAGTCLGRVREIAKGIPEPQSL